MSDDTEFTPEERATLRQMMKEFKRDKLKRAEAEAERLTRQYQR